MGAFDKVERDLRVANEPHTKLSFTLNLPKKLQDQNRSQRLLEPICKDPLFGKAFVTHLLRTCYPHRGIANMMMSFLNALNLHTLYNLPDFMENPTR